jgi:signal transduction histidine kinase
MIKSSTFLHSDNRELGKKQEYIIQKMPSVLQHQQVGQHIIQLVLSDRDSENLLSKIAGIVANVFQADLCWIVPSFYKKNQQFLGWWGERLSQQQGDPCRDLFLSNFWLDESHFLEPVNISDQDSFKEINSINSLLAISTSYRDAENGKIILGKFKSYDWTSSDKQLLTIVAESVALAISVVELQHQITVKTRYQSLIYEIVRSIGQNSDVDVLLNFVLQKIVEAFNLDRGTILRIQSKNPLLQDYSTGTVRVDRTWSRDKESNSFPENDSFELSASPLCQQALQQKPLPLAIEKYEPHPQETSGLVRERTTKAILFMPLMGNSNNDGKSVLVWGFLVLQSNNERFWSEDELELIACVSTQVSTAIFNYQSLHRIQSLVDDRTAQLKSSLDLQAKFSDRMRQQIEQLRQLNELKDDFLSSMSHELKTPLTSMKMAIKMLRQEGLPEQMRGKYLNILEEEWNREYNLIKDLLTLQQVESNQFTVRPQEINLSHLIKELQKSFTEKWQSDKGLNFLVEYSPEIESEISPQQPLSVYTDPESLQHILDELLSNAGKYSDPDTNVYLQVDRQISKQGKNTRISVTNYGAGISLEELPYIFDKFRRGQGVTDRAVPGTGLGLALVKHLVQHLNATIEVQSHPLKDKSSTFVTCFTLTLP